AAGEKSPLSRTQIENAVQSSMDGIKACYTTAVTRKPTFAGELDVSFMVNPDGKVSAPKVQGTSTAREAEFEACVLGCVKAFKFPKPGKKVLVNYPFTFVSKTIPAEAPSGPLSPDMEAVRSVALTNKDAL